MNPDCIFCKILAGTLPCVRVWEDEGALAFLDIGPIVKGHTLVIPREHHEFLTDLPPQTLRRLALAVQRIARALLAALGAEGVNVTLANGRAAGQLVPHVHFHVIPRFATDGHHWNWTARKYADRQEMKEFGDRIAAALAH
jgi:histidine triad (HIT) family protein